MNDTLNKFVELEAMICEVRVKTAALKLGLKHIFRNMDKLTWEDHEGYAEASDLKLKMSKMIALADKVHRML